MKTISSIKWTEKSVEHIARHRIKQNEVEEVCFDEYEAPLIRTGRQNLYYVLGETYSGRFLLVVIRYIRRGEVRVITARDTNAWEKSHYKRRGQ